MPGISFDEITQASIETTDVSDCRPICIQNILYCVVLPAKYLSYYGRQLQRKRASMLYFANVFFLFFFMAALFSGPGERRFAKVLHVVDLECH